MDSAFPGVPTPIRWTEDGSALHLLDQTRLPGEEHFLRLEKVEEVAEAIRSLRIRGAPAIGIAAAMGLAMGFRARMRKDPGLDPEGLEAGFLEAGFLEDSALLRSTRPTAVNLAWALDRLASVFDGTASEDPEAQNSALRAEADAIAREDREMCRLIGVFGQEVIPREGSGVLTHCNAGALATGGIGTALAPLYVAHGEGIPLKVFADETRPLLQGARLTAWELAKAGIEATVLPDSAAGALMAEGRVNLVIVGADRVASNGDVANKIGTFGLAVLARHHGIPFYVALPRSTFDPAAADGKAIPIEERGPAEVAEFAGNRTVPEGVSAWNPAFDRTPHDLVTAFITDGGILRPPFEISIARLLDVSGGGVESPAPDPEAIHPQPEDGS